MGVYLNDKKIIKISQLIVPLIIIAECFSWFAVITTNYLGNTIEESLWTISYALIFVAMIRLWPKFKGAFKYVLGISIFGNFAYIIFMIFVDVHMYYTRLLADLASHKEHLSLIEGLVALNTKWVVTHEINEWRTEIPWMSLYFSLAVLVSIGLCYLPLKPEDLKKHL